MTKVIGVLMALSAGIILVGALLQDPDARRIRQQAEADLAMLRVERAERMADVDHALGVAWRLLAFGAALGAVGLAGRWAWLALDRYERERMPRGDGLLPVPIAALDEQAALALEGQRATALAAAHAHAPAVYSPHIHVAALSDRERAEVRAMVERMRKTS